METRRNKRKFMARRMSMAAVGTPFREIIVPRMEDTVGKVVDYGGSGTLQPGRQLENSMDGVEKDENVDSEKRDIEIIFTDKLPKDLQCKQCSQILRLPQKIEACGHRLCTDCTTGLTHCPDCGELIQHDKLKVDKDAQRRIQKLGVQCTFHDNGCTWTGELRHLESHALNCEYSENACPRGCGAVISRNQQKHHLEFECPKKLITCPHCSLEITVKGMKTHLKVCPEMLGDCPNNCGLTNLPRKAINEHLPSCPKAGSICPFGEFGCDYSGGREHLQKHIKDQPVKHLSFLCDGVLGLKTLLSAVELNNGKLTSNLDILTKKVESLEKLYGAQFIWRIDNVKQKQNEAKSGTRNIIFSPPFLSGRHGYKLVLSAALFGDGKVRGLHMSMYIGIMQGEFDALLSWPFVHKVTFTLMDQNPNFLERKHVVYVVKPNASVENKAFLGRPISDRNASFGALKFCDIDVLQDYIKDDVMFVKCNIDTQNMIVL